MPLLERILLIRQPVSETWKTLSEEEQAEWAAFFVKFHKNIGSNPSSMAYLWALAHDYHHTYGRLWNKNYRLEY